MSFLSKRLGWLAAPLVAGVGVLACGASINAVYESDVRFEHCMALDDSPGVKPTTRRACWDEWVRFYTFGQTRDRVGYAKARQEQLATANDMGDSDWERPALAVRGATPDPTTVLAPPPMILGDAGRSDVPAPPPTATALVSAEPPASQCVGDCEGAWRGCRGGCRNAACEKGCAATYKRCMRKCF